MSEIINGKAVAAEIRKTVLERASAFERKHGRKVGLAVVRVGATIPRLQFTSKTR